jgi:transposase-like protein
LVSKVTDSLLPELKEWQTRPLEKVYPIIFIDAIYLKVRDGTVANRPVHVALGIDCEGNRDVLGMWLSSTSGEGAKQWMGMFTDLKNRGVFDVCIVCCDGLTGIVDAINAIWPAATIQRCVVHLIRNSLRYAQRKDMREVASDLKPIYTAPNEEAALQALSRFKEKWDDRYQAISQVWERCWSEFIPFLSFPAEVRKVIYTTNSIESLNARFRKAVRRRGHFPNEQSALKVLYLCVIRKEKNRPNVMNRINDWTQVYNTLSLMYGDRLEVR